MWIVTYLIPLLLLYQRNPWLTRSPISITPHLKVGSWQFTELTDIHLHYQHFFFFFYADYDPEDLVEPMNETSIDDQDALDIEEHDARGHYVKVGKSSLRNQQAFLLDDPRYSGERKSRKDIYSDQDSDDDNDQVAWTGFDQEEEELEIGDETGESENDDDDDVETQDDDDDNESFSGESDQSDNGEGDNELNEQLKQLQQDEK